MSAGRKIIFLLLLGSSIICYSQRNKNQLQKEKQQNLEKIKETEKILTETSQKKKNSLGELSALNQRISQQETLIASIRAEIELLDFDIEEDNQILTSLEVDVAKLKEEYAAMIFSAQKANSEVTKLTFLFSASSFDQFAMRLKYLEQYSAVRKSQAAAIVSVQAQLTEQVKQIEVVRAEKNILLEEELKETNQLISLKQKKRTVVRSLEKEEKLLRKDLEETKRAIAKLDRMIDDIIREEMEKAARERERNAGSSGTALALSSSFEENKSRLPWPVSGFVSQKFGRQRHPVLKVDIQNDGINIQTKEGEKVKCIYEGEVSGVAYIPSLGNTVIVKHGDYRTVYTGLKEVFVAKGQKLTTNQEIGQVTVNSDGVPELRFRLYKNTNLLDPQPWLRK